MADIRFSKFMVTILRHSAKDRGIQISADGFVDVDDIVALPESGNRSLEDVERIVKRDSKGRFKMRTQHGKRQIKATQGHSMKLSDDDLTPILNASQVKAVLHGTKSFHWDSIKQEGLSRRTRQHIHFAEGESGVKSGFPPGCDIVVEIDLQRAIRGGIKFFQSDNGVILTEGNGKGVIPTEYFKQVYNRHTREKLPF